MGFVVTAVNCEDACGTAFSWSESNICWKFLIDFSDIMYVSHITNACKKNFRGLNKNWQLVELHTGQELGAEWCSALQRLFCWAWSQCEQYSIKVWNSCAMRRAASCMLPHSICRGNPEKMLPHTATVRRYP